MITIAHFHGFGKYSNLRQQFISWVRNRIVLFGIFLSAMFVSIFSPLAFFFGNFFMIFLMVLGVVYNLFEMEDYLIPWILLFTSGIPVLEYGENWVLEVSTNSSAFSGQEKIWQFRPVNEWFTSGFSKRFSFNLYNQYSPWSRESDNLLHLS